eukprot:15273691-Heterocapsa_arctica.AAC.1
MLHDSTVNALIYVPAALGMAWAAKEWINVSNVKIDGHPELLMNQDAMAKKKAAEIVEEMLKIAKTIQEGAMSFLTA